MAFKGSVLQHKSVTISVAVVEPDEVVLHIRTRVPKRPEMVEQCPVGDRAILFPYLMDNTEELEDGRD